MEQIAHLISNKLDQTIPIKLSGKRLGDSVDGNQLRGAFSDFVRTNILRLTKSIRLVFFLMGTFALPV
jgi:hypothetical protein